MIILYKDAAQLKKNLFEASEYLIELSKTGKTATVYDYKTQTKQKKRIFENIDGRKFIKFKGFNAAQLIFLNEDKKEIIITEY